MYILQQINQTVFKNPPDIAENIQKLKVYLQQTSPEYLFVAALPATSGKYLVQTEEGEYFRLMPFVKGSHSINSADHQQQAFEAALQFGRFTKLLKDFNLKKLQYTLPNFHNLTLRFSQFKTAYNIAEQSRISEAKEVIAATFSNQKIEEIYRHLIENGEIPVRAIHHDTKINNVLFDAQEKGLCVIDLDTVMPGFYLSDVGDMLRTFLSPANEEEQDLSKIKIREEFFAAIYQGYIAEMGNILTSEEKKLFIYSGSLMMYMQGLRFLTDFLNGDVYYHTVFTGQNLARAKNQFELLRQYQQMESRLIQLTD